MSHPHTKPNAYSRLLLLPWLILVATLGTTWLVWDHKRQSTHQQLHAEFDFALRDTVSRIEQRVASYEQLLRGVQGLFAVSDLRNRTAMRDYVATLQIDANFAGIQAIGVIEHVPSSQRNAHVAAIRRLGFPDYEIDPPGSRDVYAPIIQREPYVGRNRAPIGFDTLSSPVRLRAMEKARDAGLPAITGKVQLAQDKGQAPNPGFIMYLPIFEPGKPKDNVAQRRAHIKGWIYAAFHMSDFMASLYGTLVPGLTFALYDDANPTAEALFYRSSEPALQPAAQHRAAISANEYMVVGGHTWTLTLSTQDEFNTRPGQDIEWVIAVAGIGLSLTMALLSWYMVTGRARALQLAADMTEELRHMAQHDLLTGLPNRALFSDRVQSELSHAKRHHKRFALIFLDLDNFKPINDQYGHAVGDLLLQSAANRLQGALRAADTVGRIGGDEFVVLLGELSGADAAEALAEKIRQEVRRPYLIAGHELHISCSLGVAVYPDDGRDQITLTKSADDAMYRAKKHGRDCVELAHDVHDTPLDHDDVRR